jgi:uncharacterized oxidoreductase
MKMTGNTILITGGASGIGLALAEAFHRLGNKVIVSGRRQQALDAAVAANPGMEAIRGDVGDQAGAAALAREATQRFPALNVVINNAGIMKNETLTEAPDYLAIAEETVATNLLGPIRLTAALLPHLLKQPTSAIMTVSSGLAFVTMAVTPTYSATKSAIHAYSVALREQLKDTATEVIEIVPPYVQTTLRGDEQLSDPRAMPLEDFITEVMDILSNQPQAQEIVVERCKPLRFAAENGNWNEMFKMVSAMD